MKSLTKNYFFDLVYRIVTLVVPLITAPYISRRIGAVGVGNYSFSSSLCSYFCFVAILGSNTYGQREIAFCNGNKDRISRKFWGIFVVRFTCTFITTLVYLFFVYQFDGVIKILLLIQLIDVTGEIFDITWLYQGLEEFGKILIRNLTMKTIAVASIFIFVKTEEDLYVYVLMVSVANVVSNLLLFIPLNKYVNIVHVSKKEVIEHIKPILKLFLPTIALNVYNQIDKTMLGWLSTSEEVGYYEQATKIIVIINTFVTSVCNIMSPRISLLLKINDLDKARQLNKKTFNLIWTLALPIIWGLIVISDVFVPVFFGAGFEKVSTLLKILSLICIPMGIKMVLGMQILVPSKLESLYAKALFGGIAVNVLLNSILIIKFDSIGASIASVVSEVSIVVFLLYRVRKDLKLEDVFSGFFKKLIAAIAMYLIVKIMMAYFVDVYVKLVCSILIGALCYFLILIILKDSFIRELAMKFRYKVRRKCNV